MLITKDTVIQTALDRIALCEQRLVAFEYAIEKVNNHHQHDQRVRDAASLIFSKLYEDALDAYRNLFMWGNLFPKAREAAKEVAMRHFVSEGHAIMQYLDIDGKLPPMFYGDDAEKFRAIIAELQESQAEEKA